MEYNFREIEKNWQEYWANNKTFAAKDGGDKPKYYVLDMFPYPSGAGLHVGHPLGYIASDIVARYKRHKGFNVLHPMGYDSFGLPAEQYAIQTGQHPKITTEQNIARYREQLDKIGFSFDWDREVRTSDPEYYKWTQWIFIQLFNSWYNKATDKAEPIDTLITIFETKGFDCKLDDTLTGDIEQDVPAFTAEEWKSFDEKKKSDILMNFRIAYLGEAYVNWCPQLGTVLANDEVKDGVSERGGYPVERKLMKQWSMRITAYAQRLLDGLDELDWTDSLKEAQRNWIGRSEGTSLRFKIQDSRFKTSEIEVFTTRPDTVFGVSFVTLAPEHELVSVLTTADQKSVVEDYVTKAKNRSERERQADVNKITGVFTGSYVLHPFTGKQIPIWVGDYVLAGYGTGAVMAVPAHDERDYKFAKHFGLALPQVIEPTTEHDFEKDAWGEKEGKIINSDFLNGLEVKAAIKRAIEEIEKRGFGKGKINYRLRDAVFGRQRYWGEPIPVYYKRLSPSLSAGEGAEIPCVVDESDLPIQLPEVDKYLPTEDGEPPLARAKNWTYSHPSGESEGALETSTMPGWAGSSWYFLRYMDAKNSKQFVSKELADYWNQVDLYIGGSEHATGHLLYVRFWTKFLKDLGYIKADEPAKKLINQGMIQGTSELIKELIIDPKLKSSFIEKSKTVLLKIKNENKYIYEMPVHFDRKNKHEHIYVSYDCNFEFEFVDKENGQVYDSQFFIHNADVNFVVNSVLDYDMWLMAQPEYKPILICNEGFWTEETRTWHNYDGTLPEVRYKFMTKSLVEKMSKSKHNVVSPDDRFYGDFKVPGIIEQFGSDTLRLYEMFLGPLEQSKPWNTNGITGVHGFLKKLWRLFYQTGASTPLSSQFNVSDDEPTKAELKTLHKTIKKVIEDIERFSFNTSISTFMICVNELTDAKCNKRSILEPLLICLSPYAPHISEELWKQLGHTESIAFAAFPEFNEAYLVDDAFNYPVSFNGKMRFNIELATTLTPQEVEKEVLANENTLKYLEGKQPKKVIVVPKKIVNIVV